jgi:hypothetical protein
LITLKDGDSLLGQVVDDLRVVNDGAQDGLAVLFGQLDGGFNPKAGPGAPGDDDFEGMGDFSGQGLSFEVLTLNVNSDTALHRIEQTRRQITLAGAR